ncbi:MAG: hypothetical protein D6763_03135 [Alphaproteobacteria bacterium]|nr:MAG: hypothetical protein D6763_03135 [Alphaproteobacteria bacterium]
MEENPSRSLVDAVKALDAETVEASLGETPLPPVLVADGEDNPIRTAHQRMMAPSSQTALEQARRILIRLIQALAKRGDGLALPQGLRLTLRSIFLSAVQLDDQPLAAALLDAGLDPNDTSLSPDDPPLLQYAINRKRSAIVRLLLNHGADPNLLPREEECVFRHLTQSGQLEYAWIILIHGALGKAPERLVNAFKIGAPDGSMEKAVADAGLSRQELRRFFRAMLGADVVRAAVAAVLGHCAGASIAPDSEQGSELLAELFDGDPPHRSLIGLGTVLYGLAGQGFTISHLPPVEQNQRLCTCIQNGDEDGAIALLAETRWAPLIWTDDDAEAGYVCQVLDLAEEQGMYGLIEVLIDDGILPFLLQARKVEHLLRGDDEKLVAIYARNICRSQYYATIFLNAAVEHNQALFLAILIDCGCDPGVGLPGEDDLVDHYQSTLLYKACCSPVAEHALEKPRFDCARVLLLCLASRYPLLPQLCDLIILEQAEEGDPEVIAFLCSTGCLPMAAIAAFSDAALMVEEDGGRERAKRLGQSVAAACNGLITFIETVASWNSRTLLVDVVECFIPGVSEYRFASIKALRDAVAKDVELEERIVLLFLDLLIDASRCQAPEAREGAEATGQLLGLLESVLIEIGKPRSLQDLAGDAVAPQFATEAMQDAISFLRRIRPEFIWRELWNNTQGFGLHLMQLAIIDQFQNAPEFHDLIFCDDPFFLETEDSASTEISHDDSSQD